MEICAYCVNEWNIPKAHYLNLVVLTDIFFLFFCGGGGGFDHSRLAPRQFLVFVCVKSAVKYEEKKLWGEGVCVWAP